MTMCSTVQHKNKIIHRDIALAQRICKELRAGNQDAIITIYDQHNDYLLSFIRSKIYKSHILKSGVDREVLNDFWIIVLSKKGEIICRYMAKNSASLRTYLTNILFNQIKSINREIKKENTLFSDDNTPDDEDDNVNYCNSYRGEDLKSETDEVELIHEALSLLSQDSPMDAKYIRMHLLEEFTYEEIARQELPHEKDNKVIKRKTDAVKKQFTRDRTGSKAKFKKILQELKESERLNTRYALV